jgi:hypothetical protein
MRRKHLLLRLQIEQLLRPSERFYQSLRGDLVINDVDEADTATCVDQLLCDGKAFGGCVGGSEGGKVDDGEGEG